MTRIRAFLLIALIGVFTCTGVKADIADNEELDQISTDADLAADLSDVPSEGELEGGEGETSDDESTSEELAKLLQKVVGMKLEAETAASLQTSQAVDADGPLNAMTCRAQVTQARKDTRSENSRRNAEIQMLRSLLQKVGKINRAHGERTKIIKLINDIIQRLRRANRDANAAVSAMSKQCDAACGRATSSASGEVSKARSTLNVAKRSYRKAQRAENTAKATVKSARAVLRAEKEAYSTISGTVRRELELIQMIRLKVKALEAVKETSATAMVETDEVMSSIGDAVEKMQSQMSERTDSEELNKINRDILAALSRRHPETTKIHSLLNKLEEKLKAELAAASGRVKAAESKVQVAGSRLSRAQVATAKAQTARDAAAQQLETVKAGFNEIRGLCRAA